MKLMLHLGSKGALITQSANQVEQRSRTHATYHEPFPTVTVESYAPIVHASKINGDQKVRHDWVAPQSALPFECIPPKLKGDQTVRRKQVRPESALPFECIIEDIVDVRSSVLITR